MFGSLKICCFGSLSAPPPVLSPPTPPTPASVNRYGTGDLCWHHAQQVLSLVLRINSLLPPFCSSASPLTSLFCRLVKFLTPQHQVSSWQVCTCCQWWPSRLTVWLKTMLSTVISLLSCPWVMVLGGDSSLISWFLWMWYCLYRGYGFVRLPVVLSQK